jgi:excinuclease ABC subunit C
MFPDLIIIDGGKGQLSAAREELQKLEVDIPIISIAKQKEEIFLPNKKEAFLLPMDSLGLKLIQRIRDEAHRFAISYHRKLRSKNVFNKEK